MRYIGSVFVSVVLSCLAFAAPGKTFPVTVLDGRTHNVQQPPAPEKSCSQLDYDAYCGSAGAETVVQNTLEVREPNGTKLELACIADSLYGDRSCPKLPLKQTFEARRTNRGLEIYYEDAKHRTREAKYEIVSTLAASQH